MHASCSSSQLISESLTQVVNEAWTDNGNSQGEQRNMNVETALKANAQFSEAGKPGMRAPNDPAMSSRSLLAFCPFRAIRAAIARRFR